MSSKPPITLHGYIRYNEPPPNVSGLTPDVVRATWENLHSALASYANEAIKTGKIQYLRFNIRAFGYLPGAVFDFIINYQKDGPLTGTIETAAGLTSTVFFGEVGALLFSPLGPAGAFVGALIGGALASFIQKSVETWAAKGSTDLLNQIQFKSPSVGSTAANPQNLYVDIWKDTNRAFQKVLQPQQPQQEQTQNPPPVSSQPFPQYVRPSTPNAQANKKVLFGYAGVSITTPGYYDPAGIPYADATTSAQIVPYGSQYNITNVPWAPSSNAWRPPDQYINDLTPPIITDETLPPPQANLSAPKTTNSPVSLITAVKVASAASLIINIIEDVITWLAELF
jgi:hypothetical protein